MELAPYQKVCDARDFRLLKSSVVLANLEIPVRLRRKQSGIKNSIPFS
jgi:hypothetical protein